MSSDNLLSVEGRVFVCIQLPIVLHVCSEVPMLVSPESVVPMLPLLLREQVLITHTQSPFCPS